MVPGLQRGIIKKKMPGGGGGTHRGRGAQRGEFGIYLIHSGA